MPPRCRDVVGATFGTPFLLSPCLCVDSLNGEGHGDSGRTRSDLSPPADLSKPVSPRKGDRQRQGDTPTNHIGLVYH